MTLASLPRLSKAAFAAAFFLLSCQPPAVQKQSPVTPKTAVNNIPTLNLGSQKYPMPSAIKQKVLAKGLNPNSMTVVPRKELKTLAEQWQQRQKSPVPNANFAIQQLIPPTEEQVSCDWDTMNICGYENVGNWDEYYDAMYNSGYYQEELCVYERKAYCAYSEDESCHISYTKMQFQGCDCPEGYEKSENTCSKVLYLKVYDESNPTQLDPSKPTQIQVYNRAGFSIFADASWTLTVRNNAQAIVFEESGYGDRSLSWEMLDTSDNKLPVGIYTATLTEGEQQKHVSIEIENKPILTLSHFDRTRLEVNGSILIKPPADEEFLRMEAQAAEDWLIEILDPLGSVVWFRRGRNLDTFLWEGHDQNNQLLYSGKYTVRLSASGYTKEETVQLEVPEGIQDVELYHDKSVTRLLDSVEKRLDVMKRDTELLMLEAQNQFPNAVGFSLSSFRPAQEFRIQQQIIPPPLPESFSYIAEGDLPKALVDEQNDRIVNEVEILRQKIHWVENVYRRFQTQNTTTPLPDKVNELKKSFYGIDTTGGCYNYYKVVAKWKRKKKQDCSPEEMLPSVKLYSAVLDENLNIRLRGYVDPRAEDCGAEPFDPTRLTASFPGTLNVLSPPEVTYTKPGFEIYLKDFSTTEAYFNREIKDLVGHVSYCSAQGCTQSNDEEVNLPTLRGTMTVEAENSSGFTVQSTKEREVVLNDPTEVGQPGNRVFLDAIVRIKLNLHRAEVVRDKPSMLKGVTDLEITNSRKKVVFKPENDIIFQADEADEEKVTENSFDLIARDKIAFIWDAKPNQGCIRPRDKHRVAAGVYTTKPKNTKVTVPLIKGGLILNATVTPVEESIRLTHRCPSNVNQLALTAKSRIKEFREDHKRELKKVSEKQSLSDKQPVAVGYYNLYGQKALKGTFLAIPGERSHISETVKSPEAQGRSQRRFLNPVVNYQNGSPQRLFDSERILLEDLAYRLDLAYISENDNAEGKCGTYIGNEHISGQITLFVDKKSCQYCAELATQLRDLLPRVTVNWIDEDSAQPGKYSCY